MRLDDKIYVEDGLRKEQVEQAVVKYKLRDGKNTAGDGKWKNWYIYILFNWNICGDQLYYKVKIYDLKNEGFNFNK